MTSMVLSEYASTEMSIHALYMHEVSSQTYSNVMKPNYPTCISAVSQKQMRIKPEIKTLTAAKTPITNGNLKLRLSLGFGESFLCLFEGLMCGNVAREAL